MGIVDDVIKEPLGGAHRDHHSMAATLRGYFKKTLKSLSESPIDELLDKRYEKFRKIGVFTENANGAVAGNSN